MANESITTKELISIQEGLQKHYTCTEDLTRDIENLMYLLNFVDRELITQEEQQNAAFFLKSLKCMVEGASTYKG